MTMKRRRPIIHYKNILNYPERVHRPRTDILVGWTKEENERYALFIQAAGRECRRRYAVYSERDYGDYRVTHWRPNREDKPISE